ncbi:MAG: EF-P lysine aminoacylase GenX [Hyphomicrobiaceae bacterium]|nr:MAG: EF-P lysine aminoacylase GenX [Hyphomicrobiaceae bacterium]
MIDKAPWWERGRHEDRRHLLLKRGRIVSALRGYFEREGFIEVEPAALQVSPGNEAHLHAFATTALSPSGETAHLYLHTSPEFAMKKLLAAGESRIVAISRVFRNRERGPLHHPEFSMLEWYRAGEPYESVMQDCIEIVRVAAKAADTQLLNWRERTCEALAEPERLSVAEAFSRYAGIDVLATLSRGTPDRDLIAQAAGAIGERVAAEDTWSDIFSRILVSRIEPRLGIGRPVILDRYPAAEAALARACADDPRVAERFELYCCGVELANAFGELTDAAEQLRRFEAEMAEKQRVHGERYPLDEDFLAALSAMPEASGAALGLDRLVMLATGARRIEEVVWTPVAEMEPSGRG